MLGFCRNFQIWKNIYQTIHSTSFIFILNFYNFFVLFPIFFKKKKYQNSEKITPSFNRFHSQILLNDFGFWDFSIDPRHVGSYGKILNPSKSSPGGLWERLIDFYPLVTTVSMTIGIVWCQCIFPFWNIYFMDKVTQSKSW